MTNITKIRNILLIGNAGRGKSTLANVLTGTNEFVESTDQFNGTKKSTTKEFEHEDITYRIIDTAGFGVSIQSTEKILNKLIDIADILSEGLNQILFLTNGRFTKEEVEAFNLLRNAIFDDRVTDYTTIVFTSFHQFQNKDVCENYRQEFVKEIKNFSVSLASTAIIYVDNPTMGGFYEQISEPSRKESRKILLTHLKTCEEVYQTETLNKFHKMVDDFDLIIKDTIEAIKNIELHCRTSIDYLREFISERRVIIENIEKRIKEVKEYMEDRFSKSVLSHSTILFGKGLAISGIWFPPFMVPGLAISTIGLLGASTAEGSALLKESDAYKLFENSLATDKEKCENLGTLQEDLRNSINKLKEIRPRFVNSEYRKQNIDKNKIEVIEDVMNQTLGKEIESDMNVNLEKNEKIKHSIGIYTVRATIEGICKLVPSPLSFYCMYRDHQETKNRDSLIEMETTIKDLREGLEVLEEKQQQLNKTYEIIEWCNKEITKLP